MGDVILRDQAGRAYSVPETDAPGYLSQGFTIEAPAARDQRISSEQAESDFGGVTGELAGAGLGALRTVTGGLSDAALVGLGGDVARRQLAGIREHSATGSTIGELAGALAPVGLPGLAGGAGAALRGGAEGAGLFSTLGRGIAAGAAEGGIYGAGQGISELALSEDPLTAERATSALGSNILYGGALGGSLGGLAAGAEYGLARGKRAIDDVLARGTPTRTVVDTGAQLPAASADATGAGTGGASLDAQSEAARASAAAARAPQLSTPLEELTPKQLDAARDAEVQAIRNGDRINREFFAGDLQHARQELDLEGLSKFSGDHPLKAIQESGESLSSADTSLKRVLDNPAKLIDDPGLARDALQRQEYALQRIQRVGQDEIDTMQRAFDAGPDGIRPEIAAGKVEGWEPSQLSDHGLDYAASKVFEQRFGSSGHLELPERLQAIKAIPDALARNAQLRAAVEKLTAEPVSERLLAIDQMKDRLAAPKPEAPAKSFAAKVLGSIPVIGKVAELAAGAQQAIGGLRGAISKTARRSAASASAFLGAAANTIDKVTPVATRALGAVRFAAAGAAPSSVVAAESPTLANLFRARTDEIKTQTAYDATGVPRMQPQARARMAQAFRAIKPVQPKFADMMETVATRRIEFLSSIIPRKPDVGGIHVGPSKWQPSDLEMRSWARSVHAVEDPGAVEERMVHGILTPEDVQAYWAVYPERAQDFQRQVLMGLTELTVQLPYKSRLSLGIFARTPVDPSMNPTVLAALQSQFANEPGTDGGTQAPKAQPQFGAIKKSLDVPTPAQARAFGEHT